MLLAPGSAVFAGWPAPPWLPENAPVTVRPPGGVTVSVYEPGRSVRHSGSVLVATGKLYAPFAAVSTGQLIAWPRSFVPVSVTVTPGTTAVSLPSRIALAFGST